MATRVFTLFGGIRADTKDLDKDLDKAHQKVEQAADKMRESVNSAGQKLGKALGVAMAAASAVAVYEIQKIAREAITLANAQEEAEANLAAVVKATGNAAGLTADEMFKMASALQDVTTYGDEVIISGMAILATFKNIGKDAFERATKAALDMSVALKQDLRSSMIMLGKALNDPITGMTAMTRAGVQFTDAQKEMAKSMIEAGNLAGAQEIIFKELEGQVKDTAEAYAKTFGGSVDQAKNAFGDLEEEIGFVITKNTIFIDLVKGATSTFKEWGKYINENREELKSLAVDGLVSVLEALQNVVSGIGFVVKAWDGLEVAANAYVAAVVTGIRDVVIPALELLSTPLSKVLDGFVAIGALDFNPLTTAFDKVKEKLDILKQSTKDVLQESITDMAETEAKWDGYKDTIQTGIDKLKAMQTAHEELGDYANEIIAEMGDSWEGITPKVTEHNKTVKALIGYLNGEAVYALKNINTELTKEADAHKKAADAANKQKDAVKGVAEATKEAAKETSGWNDLLDTNLEITTNSEWAMKRLRGEIDAYGNEAEKATKVTSETAGVLGFADQAMSDYDESVKKASESISSFSYNVGSAKSDVDDFTDSVNRAFQTTHLLGLAFGELSWYQKEGADTGSHIGFDSGGRVPGYGGGDTVPAMLERGEYVINKQAASRIGYGTLESINNGGSGGVTYNITVSPQFMTGDKAAARQVAIAIKRELEETGRRWG